ncbi:MAG: hypothetical protein ED859_17365 [Desulfuromonadales bacterium]|nr:MAG: hypothetical protein ED859_17365 [Desulfuromonadales bacterium]
MPEETFLRLQQSEGIVCQMASRLLAAFISAGHLNARNEDEVIARSVELAIKLARQADLAIESDDEKNEN